jgi:anti-sigma regulatory factor (Ser/Thr protein kinase)
MKVTRSFEHAPASVTAARRFATSTLRDIQAETLESVELMVSELASNCIRHTATGFELTITRSAREIRIEATDVGGGEPRKRSPQPTDPSGRGLQIVDMLSTDWGCQPRPGGGKTVWFTVEAAIAPAVECAHA